MNVYTKSSLGENKDMESAELRGFIASRIRQVKGDLSYRELEQAIFAQTGRRITHAMLQKMSRGERLPSLETISALAKYAGKPVAWFYGSNDKVLTFTTDQVREMAAQYDISPDDPRVLEIARQLRKMALPPEELENVITYARFLAQQEKLHPGKNGKKRQK